MKILILISIFLAVLSADPRRPDKIPFNTREYGLKINAVHGARVRNVRIGEYIHTGVDYKLPINATILAAGDGIAYIEEWEVKSNGNPRVSDFTDRAVEIDHGIVDGKKTKSIYGHLSGFAVKNGQRVKKGDVIGYIGTTRMTTPHLHYEIHIDGKAVCPVDYQLRHSNK